MSTRGRPPKACRFWTPAHERQALVTRLRQLRAARSILVALLRHARASAAIVRADR